MRNRTFMLRHVLLSLVGMFVVGCQQPQAKQQQIAPKEVKAVVFDTTHWTQHEVPEYKLKFQLPEGFRLEGEANGKITVQHDKSGLKEQGLDDAVVVASAIDAGSTLVKGQFPLTISIVRVTGPEAVLPAEKASKKVESDLKADMPDGRVSVATFTHSMGESIKTMTK